MDSLHKQIEALQKQLLDCQTRLKNPKRYPRARAILMVPCFSVWLKNRFRPHFRVLKMDGSLVEMGLMGISLMFSLPEWKKVDSSL